MHKDITTEAECNQEKLLMHEVDCYLECEKQRSDCSENDIQICAIEKLQKENNENISNPEIRKLGVNYNQWRSAGKMIAHLVALPSGLTRREAILKVLNYGCHCFPGETGQIRSIGGKGPAVDNIDGVCKGQYNCHKCAALSFSCDPDKISYKAQFRYLPTTPLTKTVICKDRENTCERAVCECDKHMAEKMAAVLSTSSSSSQHSQHSDYFWRTEQNIRRGETFDYENVCIANGWNAPPDACCGTGNEVIPFNSSAKGCCVSDGKVPKLFNPTVHECCEGEVANIGSC